jgi:CheY-like chemotaxis protein
MVANNTILIVDDDPRDEKLPYFFRLFDEDDGAKFDVLGDSQPRRHRLLCHRLGDSFQFLEMFEAMHRAEPASRYPLCIIDMIMPGSDGLLDQLRGLHVARQVRGIDPEIHIVICTVKPDIDGEDICQQVGESTHFFRMPFGPEQEKEFVLKVHALVDEWNERRWRGLAVGVG